MSLKVLVLLTLVAAASASPAPTFPIGIGGGVGGVGDILSNVFHIGGSTLGDTIGSLLGNIFGAKNLVKNVLTEILNLKIRVFGDVIILAVKVIFALGDIIDASISGLGSLFVRIVACLLKIVVCFLGSAGNEAICRNDWNTQFGVAATGAANIQALIRVYGLTDCYSKVQAYINISTQGRGYTNCRGSLYLVFRAIIRLAERINILITGRGSLTKADLGFCYLQIGTILGAIGNSHQTGLGLKIVNSFLPTCNKYIVSAGYPGFGNYQQVQNDISLGNNDNGPWAITDISANGNTGVSIGLGQLVGNVLKGILGVGRLAVNLVSDLVKIVLRSFDDVITLGIKIVLGLGGLLDTIVAGLGSLLVRIVAVLIKIVLCFLGNGSKYGVCRPGWNSQFGVSGEANSINDLIILFGVRDCKNRVNVFVNDYTNGKGWQSTTGSVRVLLQSCVTLSQAVESGKWDKSVLVLVFTQLTYMIGAVGNSNVKGSGTQLCKQFIPQCNKFLTNEGYTGFGDDQDSIYRVIEQGDGDSYLWSADINPDANKNVGFIINGGGSGSVSVGGDGGLLGGLLGGIFGVLRGVTGLAVGIVRDILNIKIKAFSDVLNLVFKLTLGIGGVIDSVVNGLGLLISRVIAVIFKIGICVKGFPGDRSICNAGWNKQFNINGDASTAIELIRLFQVQNAAADCNKYISRYNNGGGYGSSTKSVRIFFDQSIILTGYITNYQQISKETITQSFVSLTIIIASIANANKKDSGLQITQKVIPTCGKYFYDQGYPDITQSTARINVIIVKANGDSITYSNGNNGSTGGNTNTGGSTGGNTNTGGSTGGNTNTGGSTGEDTNTGGSTGKDTNTGGSTGKDTSTGGSTGKDTNQGGSTGKDTNTGGSTGKDTNTGGSTGEDTNQGGSTGKDTNTGGSTGKDTNTGGSTGEDTNTGGSTGKDTNTGGSTGKDTNTGGSTGKDTNTGGSTGKDTNTGGSTGKDTNTGGSTGKDTNTGGSTGKDTNTGGSTGKDTNQGGSTGKDTNTGGSTGKDTNTGGSTGKDTNTGGSTGKDTNTGGSTGKDTNTGGSTGKDTNQGGSTGKDTNTGGSTGKDTNTGGSTGEDTNTGGSTGKDTNTGGSTGKDTNTGGSTGKDTNTGGSTGEDTNTGGSTGEDTNTGGSTGKDTNTGGSTGKDNNTGGSTGKDTNTGGSTGEDTNTGGSTGKDTNTGGSTGKDTNTGGSTGKDTNTGGSTGKDTNTGGSTGVDTNTGGSTGEDTNTGGSTGKDTNTGGSTGKDTNTGGSTGKDTNTGGSTGKDTNTGGSTGKDTNTGGSTSKDTNTGGSTGKDTNTGGSTGKDTNTGGSTGKDTNTGGSTGKDTNTGGSTGKDTNTGGSTGEDTNTGGSTGEDTNTGGSTGKDTNTGGSTGKDTNTGGSTGKDTNQGGSTGKDTNTGGSTGTDTNQGGSTGKDTNTGGSTGKDTNTGGSTGGSVGGGVSGSVDLGGLISGVLKGIFGVGKLVSTVLTDLVNIKVTAFVQVINLVVNVSLGIGGILNSVIVGLGSLLSRIVAFIIKVGICINKFPGDKSICTKEWNANFGVTGDTSNFNDLLVLFRVNNCKTDVENMIYTASNGKGITAFSASVQIILQKIIDLTVIINSKTITKQHVSTAFVSLFTIFGAITNSYKQNSGTEVTQKVFSVCGKYFVQQGYPDVSTEQQTVIKTISGANNDKFDWTSGKAITGSGQTTVVVKGDGLVTDIKDLFKKLKNDKQSSVTAVLNLETPRNFDGVLFLLIKVVQALGSIFDLFFSGLGSILVRIVGFLLRYIVCILGGSKNSQNFVCQKAYYDVFEVTVSGNTYADLLAGFKLNKWKADLDAILKTATNNKGLDSLKGANKDCFRQTYALGNIVLEGSKITEAHLTKSMQCIITLLGSFGNSLSVGLGNKICDNFVPVCSSLIEAKGYPALTSQSSAIYSTIKESNGVEAKWTQGAQVTVTSN